MLMSLNSHFEKNVHQFAVENGFIRKGRGKAKAFSVVKTETGVIGKRRKAENTGSIQVFITQQSDSCKDKSMVS